MTRLALAALTGAAALAALPALAHDFDVEEAQAAVAGLIGEEYMDAAELPMSVTAVVAHLEELGYTEIEEFRVEDGVYEIEATDPEGEEVEIDLDPVTGEIMESEED
ncbi:MAG TPA: PepSY domain-containing protein [Thermohalobaculum sp.]|nr:PepSY domain-containing protein [Thermohalobaculum sp.]